ncbi:Odorant Hypothetical protein protein [Nesidiocoris tenuis]|uniref:Uncharacterized protein n=1 Tax=Nesidiocoris tenuis TaxID=355587 RepID=A0ABN7BCA7_9HEMI|nr:Odorant Hypothetical protein protein [Nesidiocoris tenuis]
MKSVIALIFAVALVEFAAGSYLAKVGDAKDKCKGLHNVDDETIRQYINQKKLPESQNGKCFVACIMKEVKALENGKANVAVMKEANRERNTDEAIIAKADQVIDICAQEVSAGGDECETAIQLVKCAITKGREMGIPSPVAHRRR